MGKTVTIQTERNKFDREVREALEIQNHKCGPIEKGTNLDMGKYVKTKFWMPFFDYLRKNNVTSNREANSAYSE